MRLGVVAVKTAHAAFWLVLAGGRVFFLLSVQPLFQIGIKKATLISGFDERGEVVIASTA